MSLSGKHQQVANAAAKKSVAKIEMKLDDKRLAPPQKASLLSVPAAVLNRVLFPCINGAKDVANLSGSSFGLYANVKTERDRRVEQLKQQLQQFLQAFIDDDRKTFRTLLKLNPDLLEINPAELGITEIESKLTWQRFKTESVWMMAQKLERIEMLKIILSHFEECAKEDKTKATETISADVKTNAK